MKILTVFLKLGVRYDFHIDSLWFNQLSLNNYIVRILRHA